MDYVVINQN